MTETLTATAILDFERNWYIRAGDKLAAMAERFGVDQATYDAALDGVLSSPLADRFDAHLVKRLRRMRARQNGHAPEPALGFQRDVAERYVQDGLL